MWNIILRKKPTRNGEQVDTTKGGASSQEHERKVQALSLIATAIDRTTNEKASQKEQKEIQDKKTANREWITIFLIFATAAVAIVALIVTHRDTARAIKDAATAADRQHRDTVNALRIASQANILSRNNLLAMTRAWIGPRQASLLTPLSATSAIDIEMEVTNSGHEPALHVTPNAQIGLFPRPPNLQSWGNLSNPVPDVCTDALRLESGAAEYPTGVQQYYTEHWSTANQPAAYFFPDGRRDQTAGITHNPAQDVISKAYILMLNVCYGYDTEGARHFSRACFYLEPGVGVDPAKWGFRACPKGNDAK